MKYCPKCNKHKKLTEFHIKSNSKDGYHNKCKLCVKIQNDNYYKDNKEAKIKYASDYQKQDKIKQYQSEYSKLNHKEYYLKNKKHILEYGNQYTKNRYQNDPSFKLTLLLRSRFNHALIRGHKIQSIIELLGCSVNECRQHLEKQFTNKMNWKNHGKYWEIDHIIPCASFDLTNKEQQKQCFHYTNLQPLTKKANRTKSNKL
jgi:hypothetical protein